MKTFTQQHQGSNTRASFPLQQQKKNSPPAPPPAIPPVSQSSTEVSDAERQQRIQAASRKGMKSTLLAGGQTSAMGTKSLLG